MPEDEDILDRLMRALAQRAEDSEDKNTRQLFTEVRDELKKLNAHLGGTQEEREHDEQYDELVKRIPALKSRPPRRRRSA